MKKILCVIMSVLLIVPLFGCGMTGGLMSDAVIKCPQCGNVLKAPTQEGALFLEVNSFFVPAGCGYCGTETGVPVYETLFSCTDSEIPDLAKSDNADIRLTQSSQADAIHFSDYASLLDYLGSGIVTDLITSISELLSADRYSALSETYIHPCLSYITEDNSIETAREYTLQGLNKTIECSVVDITLTAKEIAELLESVSSAAADDETIIRLYSLFVGFEYERLKKNGDTGAEVSREEYINKALKDYDKTLKMTDVGSSLLGLGIGRRTVEIAYDADKIYALRIMDSKGSGYGLESYDDIESMSRTDALVYYDFGVFKKETTVFLYNIMQKSGNIINGDIYTSEPDLSINYSINGKDNDGIDFTLNISYPGLMIHSEIIDYPQISELHIDFSGEDTVSVTAVSDK